MATFKGWPEDFQRFFIGLELDNSKKYFEANRRTYEDSVKGPMAALLESLEPDFGPGKVFRANRDIRFSKRTTRGPSCCGARASTSGRTTA